MLYKLLYDLKQYNSAFNVFQYVTVRAALDMLNDFGRPRRVRLAVLIDRGWRELPIQADYVGCRVDTESDQSVKVRLVEKQQQDGVVLLELQQGQK